MGLRRSNIATTSDNASAVIAQMGSGHQHHQKLIPVLGEYQKQRNMAGWQQSASTSRKSATRSDENTHWTSSHVDGHFGKLYAEGTQLFHAKYAILHSGAPRQRRGLFLDRVVLRTVTWAFGIIHGVEITKALNILQQEMMVSMAGWKRKPHEAWIDYQIRTQRQARAATHASERDRWGTVQLRLCWRYWGTDSERGDTLRQAAQV